MTVERLVVFLAMCAAVVTATRVLECNSGKFYEDPKQVTISRCDSPPCILKRKSSIDVQIRFTAQRDVEKLVTAVHAKILGLPLPFVGVDGSNACDLLFEVDGSKASCPLKKGKEYVYKNSFPVHTIYPRIDLVVHWALREEQEDIVCFEVPSKITS